MKNSATESVRKAAWFAENAERVKKWRPVTRERRIWLGARWRAKVGGLPFDIEQSDIVIPERCPYLGIALSAEGPKATSPSLDRIDNHKGYVKGNVIVVSFRANELKRDATAEELRLIADAVCRLLQLQVA